MDFQHISSERDIPLSFNRTEITLLSSLKGYIWHLNITSQSIGNNFVKINLTDYDNFRISNKQPQMVELDPNIAFNSAFRSPTPTSTATTATSISIASKLVSIFKKGMKRNPILFLVLKEDK